MSHFQRVVGALSTAAGRNRARRSKAFQLERMEARALLAANVAAESLAAIAVASPIVVPASLAPASAIPVSASRPVLEGLTVCVPAQPASAALVGTWEAPDREVDGGEWLSAAERAWLGARGLTGQGQIVAVIDSGIDYRHQALGAGWGPAARVVGGFDFAEGDTDPDDDGPAGYHGTHVAGIVGGRDGNRSGLAPDVAFVALRVFDDQGIARPEWIEAALRWVGDHRTAFAWPITTVNLSLGALGGNAEQSLRTALEDDLRQLREAGVFVAVAAGNRFQTAASVGIGYPAASPWVMPVAAVNGDGRLSEFSERRAGILAAPGERIVSTVPDFLTGVDGRHDDYWATSGTSMAAPQVAAASVLARQAWMRAGLGEPTVTQLEAALRAGADSRLDAATSIEFAVINPRRTIEWIEVQAGHALPLVGAPLSGSPAGTPPATRSAGGASAAGVSIPGGPSLSGLSSSGSSLSGPNLSGPNLSGPTLSGPNLSGPAWVGRTGLGGSDSSVSGFQADAAPFRAARIRIPQFPAASVASAPSVASKTVVVGDGQSAVVPPFTLGQSVAGAEPEFTASPEGGAAEARMRAIDLVLSMLGRASG